MARLRSAAMARARFPVQYVIRPQAAEHPDYRGYAGQLASGVLRVGDPVTVLPSGRTSTVAALDLLGEPVDIAWAPQSVTVLLADDVDVSRGDLIATDPLPALTRDVEAAVCHLHERPLLPGAKVLLKHTTRTVRALVVEVSHRIDTDTLAAELAPDGLVINDIGRVVLRTAEPLALDNYSDNRRTGSLLLIDPADGTTLTAGMAGEHAGSSEVTAPMPETPRIAVVGAGAAGTLTAAQLLRRAAALRTELEVWLIDPGVTGRGVAYASSAAHHLLNVPAGRMSAYHDAPDHFVRWLTRRTPGMHAGDDHVPRALYGEYLADVLAAAASGPGPERLHRVHERAVGVRRTDHGVTLVLGSDEPVPADAAVLALGNFPPVRPGRRPPCTAPPGTCPTLGPRAPSQACRTTATSSSSGPD